MSRSLNKVQIIGNLGKDPESKMTTTGKSVSNFSVALSERYKDKSGNWQDKTEWVNVVVWERLSELAAQYLKKGSKCYIEGRISTRSYEKDGATRYITEVVGHELILLDGKPSTSEQAAQPMVDDSDSIPF